MVAKERSSTSLDFLGLSQDGGWTDFDEILGVNTLKGGLLIFTTFDPCHFSLDTVFNGNVQPEGMVVETRLKKSALRRYNAAKLYFLILKGRFLERSIKPVSAS